jgi:hypothetical protein
MLDLKNYNILSIYSLFIKNLGEYKVDRNLCLGIFYMTIHIIYILVIIYNTIFKYNLINSFILLIIIYLNFLTVFLLRACPITLIEKKYINTTCLKIIFYNENNKNKDDKNKDDKDKDDKDKDDKDKDDKDKDDKDKEDKDKEDRSKVLSKYLDYKLDEFTLQGLITVGLIVAIKILIMCCMN